MGAHANLYFLLDMGSNDFFFSTLQGRMLHILPGKEKKDPTDEILGINSAQWEIFRAFFVVSRFFSKSTFSKNSFRNTI